jgi:hypothetical protein
MQTQAETRGIGDNLASADEATLDELKARTEALTDTANRWVTERKVIASEEDAIKAKTFKDQLLAQQKIVEAERKKAKQPFLDGGLAVDNLYNPLKRPCEIAYELVNGMVTVWLKKKEAQAEMVRKQAEAKARAEREKADALAREAAQEGADRVRAQIAAEEAAKRAKDAEAAVKVAAAPSKVASLYGGRSSSLRTHWRIEIDDVTKIPARTLKRLCDRPYVKEALIRALREEGVDVARGTLGVRVIEDRKAV